uniref:Ubiquitin-like domain-containing protein n=1 Tax=Mucochytrium quahogii TaxID=96639 RepID=A0A7S2SGS7_9STRA|mmetsp:Transcript_16688/g.27057  ORF Transcript_16688/g.27057 Transcript_16688/m.27057 type:complete len:505 (-) Transcript_16688:671-2185(-)|eukprot:CAMPEP_0203799958 /NCGR_PEP_ID=MMETSP0100_2-20121128/10236_1 /ASSEMBLY_ACC=CAM_ASM_000210 /TAXON_ID=96639 /ORGANISM=" , Strain NY0313808BC1" /LENGTH=504 /DNA_ID=CAMNT_0050705959 /DNA_START=607 /DNA_END=2121 /DNA_ORIENTATION=-
MGDSDSSEDDLYGDGDIGAEKSNVKERKRKNSMDSLGKGDGEVLNIKLKFLKKGENTRSGAITVNSGLGICELKDTIGKVFNEKPEKLRLIFRGHVLKDDKTLKSYKVTNDSVVHVTLSNPVEKKEDVRERTASSEAEHDAPLHFSPFHLPFVPGGHCSHNFVQIFEFESWQCDFCGYYLREDDERFKCSECNAEACKYCQDQPAELNQLELSHEAVQLAMGAMFNEHPDEMAGMFEHLVHDRHHLHHSHHHHDSFGHSEEEEYEGDEDEDDVNNNRNDEKSSTKSEAPPSETSSFNEGTVSQSQDECFQELHSAIINLSGRPHEAETFDIPKATNAKKRVFKLHGELHNIQPCLLKYAMRECEEGEGQSEKLVDCLRKLASFSNDLANELETGMQKPPPTAAPLSTQRETTSETRSAAPRQESDGESEGSTPSLVTGTPDSSDSECFRENKKKNDVTTKGNKEQANGDKVSDSAGPGNETQGNGAPKDESDSGESDLDESRSV